MCCQNSSNTLFLASSLISPHNRLDAFLQAFEVHLGPTALGCFVTIAPSFFLLLAYALPSILSCFCLFCFHWEGSAGLALAFFLPAAAISRLVVPFVALGQAGKKKNKKIIKQCCSLFWNCNRVHDWHMSRSGGINISRLGIWECLSVKLKLNSEYTQFFYTLWLTGVSTQRTDALWWKHRLRLCSHNWVEHLLGRSIGFPARIRDV